MKLSEIKTLKEARGGFTENFEQLDLWTGIGSKTNLESADVEVEYDYEAPSHTDHPYGQGTAREYHGSSVDIWSVKLTQDAKVYDEEGDKVVDVLKSGTDLMQQPWWQGKWTEWLAGQIREKADNAEPDFDEPDEYDRYDDY
jgi:hypothetical protein